MQSQTQVNRSAAPIPTPAGLSVGSPDVSVQENIHDEIAHLLSQVDKSMKRTVWVLHGCTRSDALLLLLESISDCSRLINVLLDEEQESVVQNQSSLARRIFNDGRLRMVPYTVPEKQASMISALIDAEKYSSWKPVLNKSATSIQIEHLSCLYKELPALLNQKAVGRMTQIKSSHLFLSNALVNAIFSNKINNFDDFKDLYKNKPILIVATGPSLNKQLETLKAYKDQYIIIAVDPAVPILREYDITPDYVVSIDPRKRPYWTQDGLDPKTTFVIDIGCCPDVAWSNNKKYLVTSCHRDVHKLLTHMGASVGYMMTGGSVGTSAFSLACHMGGNPIAMIGMDLAWTDGKDHADGYVSQYSKDVLQARYNNGFEIEGYDGMAVRTEKQLLYYKSWFESRAKQLTERILINCTEGGAKIDGFSQIPFLRVCQEISGFQKEVQTTSLSKEWILDVDHVNNFNKNMANILSELQLISSRLKEGIELIRKIKNAPSKRVVARIDSINKMLTSEENWVIKIVIEMFGQSLIASAEQRILDKDSHRTIKNIYEDYIDIYRSALAGASAASDFIERLIDMNKEIVACDAFEPSLLSKFKFNRW